MDAFAWPLSTVGLVLVVFVVLLLRFPDEVRGKLRNLGVVAVGPDGVAVHFVTEAIQAKEDRTASKDEVEPVLERIGKVRVLWVDDMPANNRLEAQALRELGGEVDFATSNAEAAAYAAVNRYDVVISDIGRDPPQPADDGLRLPERLGPDAPPIVYYVGHADSPATPDGHPVYDTPTELISALAARMESVRQS